MKENVRIKLRMLPKVKKNLMMPALIGMRAGRDQPAPSARPMMIFCTSLVPS
jgi:hypothetical protein